MFPAIFELSNLNGVNGFANNGVAASDWSGYSVSNAGDMNGDGIADVIIGAPQAAPGSRSYAGSSYVVFGKKSGFNSVLELSTLNGINGFVINGVSSFGFSGYSVSDAGDVNGDGITDVIIGAYGVDPGGRINAGSTYVVFGKTSGFGSKFELSTLNGSNGFAINGITANDQSGYSVSGAGDVNGDGIADVIIGALQASPGGRTKAGSSYVVFGKTSGFNSVLELSTLNGVNGFAVNGVAANDVSGLSVGAAGDVNGDGIADVIIGAQGADPGNRTSAGASYVVFGKKSGFSSALELSTLNGVNGFAINGAVAGDWSGFSVSTAGDVNGDGIVDVIVGALGAAPHAHPLAGSSYVVFGKTSGFGSVLELSTLNGANGFVINGVTSFDRSGSSVRNAGDINHDGVADVIIGARLADPGNRIDSGSSYVVFGKTSGFSSVLELSSLNGANGFTINGLGANDQCGWAVSGAGDIDGDGIADVIIGARQASPGGRTNAGSTYVVYGSLVSITTMASSSGLGALTTSSAGSSGISNVSPASQLKSGMVNLLLGSGAGMFARDVEKVANSFVAVVSPMLGM